MLMESLVLDCLLCVLWPDGFLMLMDFFHVQFAHRHIGLLFSVFATFLLEHE
jgi:hypothetical protein